METNARETRRRKIVDRGADRLALIMGKAQDLPSIPTPASTQTQAPCLLPSRHTYTASSPPVLFDQDLRGTLLAESNDAPRGEDNALPKHETSSEPLQSDTPKAIKKAEPQLRKCATNIGSRKLPLDVIKEIEPAMDSPTAQHSSNSMIDTEPRAETQLHHTNKIILKEISSSISASEVNRLLCSITIALLVVLSHLNIPLLSSGFVKSIITFRPLYLILLTDATIVFARILSLKQGCTENPKEEEQRSSEDGFDWIADVGKALEIVLVLQKAAAAAFLDCGVYVVLVVCGLLLVH